MTQVLERTLTSNGVAEMVGKEHSTSTKTVVRQMNLLDEE